MAGIKRRLGSVLGPTGLAPQLEAGTTTQAGPDTPAAFTITKTGEAKYRADVTIPRGLPGEDGQDGLPGVNAIENDAAVSTYISTAETKTRDAVVALHDDIAKTPNIYFLDAYTQLFPSPEWGYVDGQGNSETTTSTRSSAGSVTLDLASTEGILPGVSLVIDAASHDAQWVMVESVTDDTVTLTDALTRDVPTGTAVRPFWSDEKHPTAAGYLLVGRFIAYAEHDGEPIIKGPSPKVTYLGNSWWAWGSNGLRDALLERLPNAQYVNISTAGHESHQLVSRFDADVPSDSDYVVINEPGGNDVHKFNELSAMSANLEALWRKTQAIGATLIYLGVVPSVVTPARAKRLRDDLAEIIGDGTKYPAITSEGMRRMKPIDMVSDGETSLGIGRRALDGAVEGTGNFNTAIGDRALAAFITGYSNTAVGYLAGTSITTGRQNSAFGTNALSANETGFGNMAVGHQSLTNATGSGNVAIGWLAGREVTTAVRSVFIGYNAGNEPDADGSQASTTENYQTVIGALAGGQGGYITVVGYRAVASADNSTAIGRQALAASQGAVAIGVDSGGNGAHASGQNDFVLGTTRHRYKMPGLPTSNPGAGTGILWNDNGTVKVA